MTPDVETGRLLLRSLREEGLSVASDGETLALSPASRLDETLRTRVRGEKAPLIAALRMEHAEEVLDLVPVRSDTEARKLRGPGRKQRRRPGSPPRGQCRECGTTAVGPTATTCGPCRRERWKQEQGHE